MKDSEKAYSILLKSNSEPKSELNFSNPFECLVAVILSAQCLDKSVNKVSGKLFALYPDAHTMSKAKIEDVANVIKSLNFYNNKAKHIISASKIICEKFDGKVPDNFEDLITLAGVSRKTAQVVLTEIFQVPCTPVDTHIFRVINRVFGQKFTKPIETEKYLKDNFKKSQLINLHKLLVLHGRYVCKAKNPNCNLCELKNICCEIKKEK